MRWPWLQHRGAVCSRWRSQATQLSLLLIKFSACISITSSQAGGDAAAWPYSQAWLSGCPSNLTGRSRADRSSRSQLIGCAHFAAQLGPTVQGQQAASARPFRAESLPPGMRTTAFRRSPTRGASVPPGRARSSSRAPEAAPKGVQPRRPAEAALQVLEIQLRQRLQVLFHPARTIVTMFRPCIMPQRKSAPCRASCLALLLVSAAREQPVLFCVASASADKDAAAACGAGCSARGRGHT